MIDNSGYYINVIKDNKRFMIPVFTKLTLAAFLLTASLPAYCQEAQQYDEEINSKDLQLQEGSERPDCTEYKKLISLQGYEEGNKIYLAECKKAGEENYRYVVFCQRKRQNSKYCQVAQSSEFRTESEIKYRLDNPIKAPS